MINTYKYAKHIWMRIISFIKLKVFELKNS